MVPKKRRKKDDKHPKVHADLRDTSGSPDPLKPSAESLTRVVNQIRMNGATSQPSSTTDNRKAPDIRSVALGWQDTGKDKATQPGDTREKNSQRGVIVKDKHIGTGNVIEDGKCVVCDFMIRLSDGTQVLQKLSTPVRSFFQGTCNLWIKKFMLRTH